MWPETGQSSRINLSVPVSLPPLGYPWARHSTPISSQQIRLWLHCAASSPSQRAFCCCCRLCGRICWAWLSVSLCVHPFNLAWCCRLGQGSLCLPSDGWLTRVDRCGRQRAHLPSSRQSALDQVLNFRVCLIFWSVQVYSATHLPL